MEESEPRRPAQPATGGLDPKTTANDKGQESKGAAQFLPKINPTPAEHKERRECRPDQTPRGKMVLEIGAVAVGVVVAFIYFCQLQTMREALAVDQRAWVGSKTFAILNLPFEPSKPIQIGLDYWNFGKTPALKVSGFVQPDLVVSDAQVNFSKWGEPLEAERSVMFPGSSNHLLRTFQGIPDPVFSDFTQGKSFLYIYGNIGYDDIFGFHHWTHFCLRYFIPSNGFVYCETFNDVDNERK